MRGKDSPYGGDSWKFSRSRPYRAVRYRRLFTIVLSIVTGCQERTIERQPALSVARTTVTPAPAGDMRANPEADDGQWVRAAKDYASSRYSALDQITTQNVAQLKQVVMFSTGVFRGQEAAPIVVNNTMYIVTPYPNILIALDLTKTGFPVKWRYTPKPEPAAQGVACCDVVNRGAVYVDGKIIYNTLDNHTVAIDAVTGTEAWNTKMGDINLGETMTMAPLAVHHKVIVGNSGGEMGVRGWIAALDVASGAVVWKAYHTGPDRDILIGAGFKPFYAKDQGTDLGVKTWPGDTWKIGGGTAWGWISYDSTLNLIYYGSGNPGPWNPDQRPGDNKWTSTLFARNPDDGRAVWAYQMNPHDLHDYDGVNENILLDMPVHGQTRHVLVHPDRNGYMYVLDRATGELLSADPFGTINSSTGVDVTTGKLSENPAKHPDIGTVVRNVCPSSSGVKDWQPSAFSPRTGMLYVPHNNLCMDIEAVDANYIAGTPYVGMNVKMFAGIGGNAGVFSAWDPVARKEVWSIKERFPAWSGALVTAGDVVFYGNMEGWFKAVDARTGKLLWRFQTTSGIIGQPVSFRGPDGKQYIAVLSGVGGWAGAIVAGQLDARDSSSALGFANASRELPKYTQPGGALYVFALP